MSRIPSRIFIPTVFLVQALVVTAAELPAATRKERNRAAADAFFAAGAVVHLAIEASEAAMASLRRNPREDVRVTLREGNVSHGDIALHLKGGAGSFRTVDSRPSFTLDFNHFQPGARFHGLKKLHLKNSEQDPSRLSELIGGELFREAGVPAARAAHALVELNGRRLGLYVAVESMDGDFLAGNFPDKNGNLYGQTRACDVTDRIERMKGDGPPDFADLKALAAAVQESNAQVRLAKMRQRLDVERFISFMAMEAILAHADGYTFKRHNYRLYHDPSVNRFTFIPHDLDRLMKRTNLDFEAPPLGLVAQAVTSTPELHARYRQRVRELAARCFAGDRLTSRVDRAVAAMLPTIRAYDPEIAAAFTSAAGELKARIIDRGAALQRRLEITKKAVAQGP